MKKAQLEKFIEKFLPDTMVSIRYFSDKEFRENIGEHGANCVPLEYEGQKIMLLAINRSAFNHTYPDDVLKAVMMHEIGHAKNNKDRGSQAEYTAHRWALNKSKKLGMKDVVRVLRYMVKEWSRHGWNEDGGIYRKYIIASRRLKHV